jgi:ligand-binding sensor domain-containing protein
LLLSLLNAAAATAQYRFDTWTTARGLPQNSVTTLQQSRDGYLWLGTFGGLVRFDGVTFTVFDTGRAGPRSLRILALYEDRAGALWMGTERGGLTRYADGTFTTYTTRDGLPVDTVGLLSGDRHGRIWSSTTVGLVRFGALDMIMVFS